MPNETCPAATENIPAAVKPLPEAAAVRPEARPHRISRKEKSAYSLGALNDLIMNNILNNLINPVYNLALHVSPDLTGYAMAVPRAWDAISDPLVASWSDNFRSKWGRRKPFMLIGALISAASFIGIWLVPPHWGSMAMVWYLILLSVIFYTGNTFFLVPYNGFGYALSDDYNERTALFAYKAVVGSVGGFLLPWCYWFITRPFFSDTIEGVRFLSIGVAAVILLSCLVPVLFCRERYDHRIAQQEKIPLFQGIRDSLKLKPFVLLIASVSIMFMSIFVVSGIGFFLNVCYVFDYDEDAVAVMTGLAGTLWKVSSLLSIPLIFFLSRKFGKKTPYLLSMALAWFAAMSAWWFMTPENPYLQLIMQGLLGPGFTCVLMLTDSMMADICDLDELKTGKRREAMLGAIYGWFLKVGVTGSAAVSGVLLLWTGFDIDLPAQSAETILKMRLYMALIPAAGVLVSLALMAFYPLTSARVAEIKLELEKRKAEESAQA